MINKSLPFVARLLNARQTFSVRLQIRALSTYFRTLKFLTRLRAKVIARTTGRIYEVRIRYGFGVEPRHFWTAVLPQLPEPGSFDGHGFVESWEYNVTE